MPDTAFRAMLDIELNNQIVSSSEATIRSCEDELITLRALDENGGWGWFWRHNSTSSRVRHLLKKIEAAEKKVEIAEKKNSESRKVLTSRGTY